MKGLKVFELLFDHYLHDNKQYNSLVDWENLRNTHDKLQFTCKDEGINLEIKTNGIDTSTSPFTLDELKPGMWMANFFKKFEKKTKLAMICSDKKSHYLINEFEKYKKYKKVFDQIIKPDKEFL